MHNTRGQTLYFDLEKLINELNLRLLKPTLGLGLSLGPSHDGVERPAMMEWCDSYNPIVRTPVIYNSLSGFIGLIDAESEQQVGNIYTAHSWRGNLDSEVIMLQLEKPVRYASNSIPSCTTVVQRIVGDPTPKRKDYARKLSLGPINAGWTQANNGSWMPTEWFLR